MWSADEKVFFLHYAMLFQIMLMIKTKFWYVCLPYVQYVAAIIPALLLVCS